MILSGKTALVTGGARGIGREIALKFAENGADIAINYTKSADEANSVVEIIKDMGRKAAAIKCDVTKPDDVKIMVSNIIKEFGNIDILVNNAGITHDALLLRMKDSDWNNVLNINLTGAFNCTKAVIPHMIKKRSGKIVNITSVIGIIGNIGQCNYAASKAGLIGFTKSVAKELGSRNININAVAPGFIDTDMTKILPDDLKKDMIENIPLKRAGKTEDVANTVLFLVSDYSNYITGQVIHIDGGMVM